MPWDGAPGLPTPSCCDARQALRQRLEAAGQLAPADVEAVWRHACHHAAEMVLEGIARAGAGTRCTAMGRSAMSLDLQVLQRGIAQVRGAHASLHRDGHVLGARPAVSTPAACVWANEP